MLSVVIFRCHVHRKTPLNQVQTFTENIIHHRAAEQFMISRCERVETPFTLLKLTTSFLWFMTCFEIIRPQYEYLQYQYVDCTWPSATIHANTHTHTIFSVYLSKVVYLIRTTQSHKKVWGVHVGQCCVNVVFENKSWSWTVQVMTGGKTSVALPILPKTAIKHTHTKRNKPHCVYEAGTHIHLILFWLTWAVEPRNHAFSSSPLSALIECTNILIYCIFRQSACTNQK